MQKSTIQAQRSAFNGCVLLVLNCPLQGSLLLQAFLSSGSMCTGLCVHLGTRFPFVSSFIPALWSCTSGWLSERSYCCSGALALANMYALDVLLVSFATDG